MISHNHITSNLNDPETYYFISTMTGRLEYANQRWATVLERRFGKKFRPIFLHSAVHDEAHISDSDFILATPHGMPPVPGETYIHAFEDANELLCEDPEFQALVTRLADRQGQVFALLFNTALFHTDDPRVTLLGPDADIARQFDGKADHLGLFKELGILPQKIEIFDNFEHLRAELDHFPVFVTASYSSVGGEAMEVHSPADLDKLGAKLRPLNRISRFVASELIEDIVLTPNVSALIVAEDDVRIVCISDQILNGQCYLGNLWPATISEAQKEAVRSMTRKVGNYLASQGYRGMFGMDFLINAAGTMFPTDLNARRQGTYIATMLASKTVDLVEQECRLFLGEPLDDFTEEDLQYEHAWSISRLPGAGISAPYTIINSAYVSSPNEAFAEPGGKHWTVYYPAGSRMLKGSPGQYVATHTDRAVLAETIAADVKRITRELFSAE